MSSKPLPLCVDVDGTLIASDLLWESLFSVIKKNPMAVFLVPFWLLQGRAYLKQQLALRSDLSVETLPYRKEVLDFVAKARYEDGCEVFLATAADERLAEKIQAHLGGFSGCFASDGKTNLKGARKAQFLRDHFPDGFSYVGDSDSDQRVFDVAASSYLVSGAGHRPTGNTSLIEVEGHSRLKTFLKAIRVHQWVKNLLIFIPLLTSHRLTDLDLLFDSILGFASFSLIASAVYILNDLLDLDEDRRHRTKRYRPIAAGSLPIPAALAIMAVFVAMSLAISLLLPFEFRLVLVGYVCLTMAYSFFLKRVLVLDVVLLACLYTSRILAGVILAGSIDSLWILLFSIFFFFSLAVVKRVVEVSRSATTKLIGGRAYSKEDQGILTAIGIGSGLTAVLVFTLYIQSPAVNGIYLTPELLWLINPILIYWICRVWLLVGRQEISDDPVLFAIRDFASYGAFLLIFGVALAASWVDV